MNSFFPTKNNIYQRYRFLSLIGVQVVLLYALPELIYHLAFNDPNYWRWYGFTFAWPLFFNTFFDNPPLFNVMQFARNQQEFSNKNTSCIQCGICIAVCPMDVLKFGDQPVISNERDF